jgi:hypothetical protein
MNSRDWFNQSQPQTLQIAVFLLYINAVFAILDVFAARGFGSFTKLGILYYGITIVGGVLAGRGIAHEKKWGWILGLVTAITPFAVAILDHVNPLRGNLLTVLFEVALVALLVHPQSREYERLWFK